MTTVESRFFEPPGEKQIGSNHREFRKTEGSRNRDSTVLYYRVQECVTILCLRNTCDHDLLSIISIPEEFGKVSGINGKFLQAVRSTCFQLRSAIVEQRQTLLNGKGEQMNGKLL